jgi:acyl-CoA synthetase (AMP-forming)/AMP-acid ligase II
MKTPAQDQACRDRCAALLENVADYVALHARRAPGAIALVEHNTGERITWKQLDTAVDAFAARLLSKGFRRGDVIATSLPLLKEHVYLVLACYRIGVVIAPLDLRLRPAEIKAAFEKLMPRGYFFLGGVPALTPIMKEVVGAFPTVRHWVQLQKERAGILPHATWIKDFTKGIGLGFVLSRLTGSVRRARRAVHRRDGCLVLFTTGSTGSPKAAMLCHEGILVQNVALAVGFGLRAEDRMLVNLPPGHVGCMTELLGTSLYEGLTSVLLHIFDAEKSLEAIQQHAVTVVGQIPALFTLEWNHPRYREFDLRSLRLAIYGGQAVPRAFLDRLRQMAPEIGTGLGLTEMSGFCSYTALGATADDLGEGVGYDMPLSPISIREPMADDGASGTEKPRGEVGEVCFSGPQIFLGYLNDPGATAKAVSKDGWLYTGDLGALTGKGLKLAGRSKLTIKPKGFNVYPTDVEDVIVTRLAGRVNAAACVGVDHAVWGEAVLVFVEPSAGQEVTAQDVLAACREIASYARPSHVELVGPGGIPLNRVAKTDYMALRERAKEVVAALRAKGKWDRAAHRD